MVQVLDICSHDVELLLHEFDLLFEFDCFHLRLVGQAIFIVFPIECIKCDYRRKILDLLVFLGAYATRGAGHDIRGWVCRRVGIK